MENLKIRKAKISDVAEIILLLQDDMLGKSREMALQETYIYGLNAIIVAENNDFGWRLTITKLWVAFN